MADVLSDMINAQFLGMPVIGIIVFFVVVIIILILKFKKKGAGRKRLELAKEVKAYFDSMYDTFHEDLKKSIMQGFNKIGNCVGHFSVYWDSTTDLKTALKNVKDKPKIRAKLLHEIQQAEKDNKNWKELIVVKYCGRHWYNKATAKVLKRYHYMLVPAEQIDLEGKEVKIDRLISRDDYLGVIYFSYAGKQAIENIAFKINRQEELTEIADYYPKQNYLEVDTAKTVALKREQAEIEKKKYEGQVDANS